MAPFLLRRLPLLRSRRAAARNARLFRYCALWPRPPSAACAARAAHDSRMLHGRLENCPISPYHASSQATTRSTAPCGTAVECHMHRVLREYEARKLMLLETHMLLLVGALCRG